MPSTFTERLGLEKIGAGEQDGTWGTTLNENFDLLGEAISGYIATTLPATGSTGTPNDLPITDGASSIGRNAFIELVDGGDLGGTAYVRITPNTSERLIHFRNSLSGSQDVVVFQGTYSAPNAFTVPNGADVQLLFNGGGTGATVTDMNVNLVVTGLTITTLSATTITATTYNGLPVASLTVSGTVELATVAETNTGTDATRAVTPDGLDGWTGNTAITTVGTIATGTWEGNAISPT